MAATEADAEPTKVLEFGLGDGTYCLDIGVIDEIVDAGELTRIPNSPEHVEGVMDLRGRTTTIVDPKTLFAIEEDGPRERIVVFEKRRDIVVDQPAQYTRALLTQFSHLEDTNRDGGHVYAVREEDVWNAPYETLSELVATVRSALGGRHEALEEWIEGQWERAHKFRLETHEDGYVVLEARSADLLGNVAEPALDDAFRDFWTVRLRAL